VLINCLFITYYQYFSRWVHDVFTMCSRFFRNLGQSNGPRWRLIRKLCNPTPHRSLSESDSARKECWPVRCTW